MSAKELLEKAHALQSDLLAMDGTFPWSITASMIIDTVGGAVLTVKLHGYGDDHVWHLKNTLEFSNYPNEKQTWDEFMDKVNEMIWNRK